MQAPIYQFTTNRRKARMSKYYQDLVEVGEIEVDRMNFVFEAIRDYKSSEEYKTATIAEDYARQQNTTIVTYQKLLYTISGKAVPDNISANYKLCSNFFNRFITQLNQYLLGNGVSFSNDKTKDALGDKFDNAVQSAGKKSLMGGESFGFWNYDHVDVFGATEFVPLYDEENGALKAGIRFWQIDDSKPQRATLYELDGYTEYIWKRRQDKNTGTVSTIGEVLKEKTAYKLKYKESKADGEKIYEGENYKDFPIVPLFANEFKQSELVGLRENIDCYDLIKSGFANDIDDASQIYWTITNAGGMDDMDLVKFVERMKTVKATTLDNNEQVQTHTMDVPYESREKMLDRLRSDMYDDFMALDTKIIAGGAVTATQIEAAYEPLNSKADEFEYQVTEFIQGILKLIGIDDTPTYTRSKIVNKTEEIQIVTQAAMYLTPEYCTEKILTIMGDADKIDEVKNQIQELQLKAQENQGNSENPDDENKEDEEDLEI